MKLLFLLLFSTFSAHLFAASCCVSNTSVSNLMILPAKWQQTFTFSQSQVIGDVDEKGSSTFRRGSNKEVTQLARLDLAYSMAHKHQVGISAKYQNKKREFNGSSADSSGWSDLGLSYAFQPKTLDRLWFFQTLNIPTAKSVYDSKSTFAVDARGTGTYQTSTGLFGIYNAKEWDFIYTGEIHYSFDRTIHNGTNETHLGSFWGTSLTAGAGYIPWRSKARYGLGLTPRLEGGRVTEVNGEKSEGRSSLVWDSSVNWTYTLNAENAVGLNYIDQTLFGPVRNTLLNRSISFLYQKKWP